MRAPLRYAVVAFDLDGTLVDSRRDISSSMNLALRAVGLAPLAEEAIHGHIGDGVGRLVERCLGPRATETGLVERLTEDFLAIYAEHLVDTTRPYPDVAATLDRLRAVGAALAVLTNKPQAPSRRILEALGLWESFGLVLGGDSTRRRKPDPEPVREAMRRLGGRPEATLVVGDLPQDVQMGKAAGVATCAVTYGLGRKGDLASVGPDHMIDRFADLPAIVEGGGQRGGSHE